MRIASIILLPILSYLSVGAAQSLQLTPASVSCGQTSEPNKDQINSSSGPGERRESGLIGKGDGSRVFNVVAYGAIGDGITDDTAAVQAAVDSAIYAGGEIYLPSGRFLVKRSVRLAFHGPPNATIVGSGPATVILHPTAGDAIRVVTRPFSISRGFKAANFVIDCQDGPGNGLHIEDVVGSNLEDITARDCNGTATSAGFWFTNQHGWTEETNAARVSGSNNSINFRFAFAGALGSDSFGYTNLNVYCEGNKGIVSLGNATSVCLQTEGNAMLYNSFIKIRANEGNYILSALGTSSIVGDSFDIIAESTLKARPVAFNIARGANVSGSFSHINLLNFTVPASSFPYGVFSNSAGVQFGGTYGTGSYTGPNILLRGAGTSAGLICDIPSPSEPCGIFINPNGALEQFVIQGTDHPGASPYLSISQPSGDTAISGTLRVNKTSAVIGSGNGLPSGGCQTGSLYLNVQGRSGSTLYVCVTGAWTDVK